VIVLVFVIRENAVDARAGHFEECVIATPASTWVIESLSKLPRQTDLLVELPQRQESGITGQLSLRWFDPDADVAPKIEIRLPSSLYTQGSLLAS
jgi:hypothetical protein